jgi:hypothetical protein
VVIQGSGRSLEERATPLLSTVHINRMMQELRGQGLVTSKGQAPDRE